MIDLTATPQGHGYLIDCTECGPLGYIERTTITTYSYAHLATHGVDVPDQTPTCECGYDATHPTGNTGDRARCLACDWRASGVTADHEAHHHYLTQKHPWELQMGRP